MDSNLSANVGIISVPNHSPEQHTSSWSSDIYWQSILFWIPKPRSHTLPARAMSTPPPPHASTRMLHVTGRTNLEISHEYINYTTASTGSLFYLKTSGCHFLSAYHINAAYSSDTPPPHTLRPAQTGNDRWHLSDKIMTCTISATQDITESLMKHAVKSCVLETQIQIMRRLTTGMRSEKCVVRRFRRCANVYWQEPR